MNIARHIRTGSAALMALFAATGTVVATPDGNPVADVPSKARVVEASDHVVALTLPYANSAPAKKIVIHSQSELPTFSYKLIPPSATALFDNNAALLALAKAQRKDAEATLAKYEISDKATLRDLYEAIRDAALLEGDAKSAISASAKMRDLSEKPAQKLTSGLMGDAAAAALSSGGTAQQREAVFQQAFAASLNALPWALVGDAVIAWKGQLDAPVTEAMLRGNVETHLDPMVKQSGEINGDAARELINGLMYVRQIDPYSAQAASVLASYIAANKQTKTDIWAKRKVVLDAEKQKLTPVIVAVWDEGVDVALFPGRLFTNAAEKADGKDDDGNGFVDDIHGIGYDEDDNPATESLIPFEAKYPGREAELRELSLGRRESEAGVDSTAANAYRNRAASVTADEVAALMEAGKFYDYYAHGTHVAGIAMDSNPAARLMVIRSNSSGYKIRPPAETPEMATRWASHIKAVVDYMKDHSVRVVNMSWGFNIGEIEISLEKNGIGKTATERRKIAIESFRIQTEALTEALRNAPEILFIPGAGNSNSDIGFARFIPADIDLPNVLAVGAVDQAGDEASFTSYGARVRVYADGFQVDSMVPGGSHMRGSGTSMAAPQVTNLAAKLFALNPKLAPTEVIKLIVDGATKSSDGKRLLINPKASVALLESKH